MNLISDFASTKLDDWQNGGMWLLYTLIGGLVPFWGSAILLLLFNKWEGLNVFFQHGEFAIYSAPLLAYAIHATNKDKKSAGFKSRSLFALAAICGLLVSLVLFAGVTSKDIFSPINVVIDFKFLRASSFYLFSGAVVISFFTYVLDSSRTVPDIAGVRSEEMNELEKDFNKMRRGEK